MTNNIIILSDEQQQTIANFYAIGVARMIISEEEIEIWRREEDIFFLIAELENSMNMPIGDWLIEEFIKKYCPTIKIME